MTIIPTFLDSYTLEAYCAAAWVDLTAYVISNIEARSGMPDGKPTTRLADSGSLSFTLNNADKLFNPASATALAGWKKGVPVRLTLVYDGVSYVRFRGYVKDLTITQDAGTLGQKRVLVNCADWLDYAASHPLLSPGIYTERTGDEALGILVPTMPIQPQATDYAIGASTFPALFDTVTTKTKAYSEFSKIAFSEPGFIYIRKDKTYGETLVFESAHTRSGLRELTEVPIRAADSRRLLKEDGSYLLLETGDKLILDETEEAYYDNTPMAVEVTYGQNIINRMAVTCYPKRVSSSAEVLYSLDAPMLIGAGEIITFRAGYSDPTGGASANADPDTMIAPVATTDYTMFENQDGSGTDMTTDLTVTAVYSAEGVVYTLTNGATTAGWITFLQARGYGIFQYNPLEAAEEDAASYNEYGYSEEALQMQYQREIQPGQMEARKIVEAERQPRTVLTKVHFNANSSPMLMQSFLSIEIGDLVHIADDQADIDGWYYINGNEFTITPAQGMAVIYFSWVVRRQYSFKSGLTPISIQTEDNSSDMVTFDYLPQVSNLPKRSYSAWISHDGSARLYQGFIASTFSVFSGSGNVGIGLYVNWDRKIGYIEGGSSKGAAGHWQTTSAVTEKEFFLVATRDDSNTANLPIIYVNGVSQPLTTVSSQTGYSGETGLIFRICSCVAGNTRDVRVYNRILSSDEVLDLYADGPYETGNVSGLVFQAPGIRSDRESDYNHANIGGMKIVDNVYGVVGRVSGSPKAFFEKIGVSTYTSTNGTMSTAQAVHAVTPGDNRLLIVLVAMRAFTTVSTITYGAQNLTKYRAANYAAGNYPRYEIWYLVAPTVGSNTITVTFSGNEISSISAMTIFDVDQVSPIRGYSEETGTGASVSAILSSHESDMVIDILSIEIVAGTGTVSALAGQVQKMNYTPGGWVGATSTKPGAASVTTGWTVSSSPHNWIYASISLRGA